LPSTHISPFSPLPWYSGGGLGWGSPHFLNPYAIALSPLCPHPFHSPKNIFSQKSADFPKIGTKRAPFGPIYGCTRFSIHFPALPFPAAETGRGKKKTHRRIPGKFGHFRTFPSLRSTMPGSPRQFKRGSRRGAEAQRKEDSTFPPLRASSPLREPCILLFSAPPPEQMTTKPLPSRLSICLSWRSWRLGG